MANNGRIRGSIPNFSMIPNELIEDKTVSFSAKGLYCLIARQLMKPNWVVYKKNLMTECKEGERAFNSAWKELLESGYLKAYRCNGDRNKFYWEYELLRFPEPPQEATEPQTEPRKEGAVSIPYKTYPMQSVGGADRGVYTVYKNTEDINTEYISPPTPSPDRDGKHKTKAEEQREIIEAYEKIQEYVPEDVKRNSNHRKQIVRALAAVAPSERVRAMKQAKRSYEGANATIKKPLSYFMAILVEELRTPTQEATGSQNRQRTGKDGKKGFMDFEQRNYDYEDLLKAMGQG